MVKRLIITAFLVLFSSSAIASSFVNVKDDQVIRANGGQVVIVVDGLSILSFDGESLDFSESVISGNGKLQTVYTINDVDRGTHELTVTDEQGSETITVHVQRVKVKRK